MGILSTAYDISGLAERDVETEVACDHSAFKLDLWELQRQLVFGETAGRKDGHRAMWRAYESDSDAPSDACDSRILSATLGSLVADPDLRPSACSADNQSPALVAPLSRIDADPQSPLLPVTYTAFIAPCFEMCTLGHRDSYSRRSESPYRAAPHAASSAISSSAHMRMPSCHHAIMPSCHHAWSGAPVSARDALAVQGGSRRRCGVPWRRRRDAEKGHGRPAAAAAARQTPRRVLRASLCRPRTLSSAPCSTTSSKIQVRPGSAAPAVLLPLPGVPASVGGEGAAYRSARWWSSTPSATTEHPDACTACDCCVLWIGGA